MTEDIEEQPDVVEPRQVDAELFSEYKIICENVYKTYLLGTNAVPALRGVDLNVKEGEFISLMGPSGCGKTTLLNLIGGLDTVTKGRILLDGQDMAKLTDNQLADLRRDKIGYVFQFYNLLPLMTAMENVMIPLHFQGKLSKRGKRLKAMELLRLVGLEERAEHTPSELSGGEQQRVAIARSFANDPVIVLLDEPTGDLDSKTGTQILHLLRDLNKKGATFIAATHDAGVTEYTSRVIHIRDGKIITGLAVRGLKETEEQRATRLSEQEADKLKAREMIQKFVAGKKKVTIQAIEEHIPREIIENLPQNMADIVKELIEEQLIWGRLEKDVLDLTEGRTTEKPEKPSFKKEKTPKPAPQKEISLDDE
ncbi:MAG TPA: ABC transporter ATP-binding protein [Candidatus Lokiarchaeia archaeon]|nr:ABC transporter ATP-binding protein [Candidatus Lokiarchaeia archaeon]